MLKKYFTKQSHSINGGVLPVIQYIATGNGNMVTYSMQGKVTMVTADD